MSEPTLEALGNVMDVLLAKPAQPTNVVPLRAATVGKRLTDRATIEAQVSEACRSRNIYGLQAETVHKAWERAFANGCSTAACVEASVIVANQIVRDRACVRSRGRDDLPPEAA